MLRSLSRRTAMLLALALAAPAAALAQAPGVVTLDGDPLNIYVGNDGGLQASVDGYDVGEFYPPVTFDSATSQQIPNPDANAGFGIVVFGPSGGSQYFSKFNGSTLTNPEGPTLTPGNPATVSAAWTISDSSGAVLRIDQLISYTNGSRQADATWTVRNVGTSAVQFRAGVGGDFAIRGSDSGVGFLDPGPPRFVGGVNPRVGAAGGFAEITPWSHFQVSQYGQVSSNFSNAGLNDQIEQTEVDNGAGVQWSNFEAPNPPLQPGASAEFRTGLRFVDTLGIDPVTQSKETGQEAVVTAKLADINGTPRAGQKLSWQVFGANTGSGSVTTGSNGSARLGYIGGSPGQDQLTIFVDTNGDGQADFDETQATATVEWTGPSAPIQGQTVNVDEVKGSVRVQLPKGFSASRAKALGLPPAALHKFIPLSEAQSIPLKSTVDTTRGTVRLLSAGRPNKNNSSFNGGTFRGGRFRVTQPGSSGLTELSMKGGGLGACKTRVPRGGSRKIVSAARRRSLFARGRGRFRTRGRNSSATVRGTQWIQKDTCAGTLTTVKQGTVIVRDFTKGKTIRLKKGRKYLARPPRGKRRR